MNPPSLRHPALDRREFVGDRLQESSAPDEEIYLAFASLLAKLPRL
jgi:hypothetical protein